jgi:hypothetical protein
MKYLSYLKKNIPLIGDKCDVLKIIIFLKERASKCIIFQIDCHQ